ncbi:MAG: methyltransferase domain-containing protein [Actinomycetota bacterium]
MSSAKLDKIQRGNTSPGVNREIIKYLLSLNKDFAGDYFLDIPCGEGTFLQAVKDFFPNSKTVGGDVCSPPTAFSHHFLPIDAQRNFSIKTEKKFKIITSISGVMEFDNTLSFFEQIKENLTENGLLIVTNDNLLSVRDRILYLLFGRFRQYRLFIQNGKPTWKIITLQNLLRILAEAGFEMAEIKYVPAKKSEWIWLPFALPIYAFQYLYMRFGEKETSFAEKRELYPFSSLLSRHYVVVCSVKR